MLDLLYTLRSVDGSADDNPPECAWQDLPGHVKRDNEHREVALTTSYKRLLRRLQEGAPSVIATLEGLARAAEKAGSSAAARDARVASGWLRRLRGRDLRRTTWNSDYSRLDGVVACVWDAQVGLEAASLDEQAVGEDLALAIVVRYVNDLAHLQPEMDMIERSRTTLAQKVFRRLSATMAALQIGPVEEQDDFWKEESVGSHPR